MRNPPRLEVKPAPSTLMFIVKNLTLAMRKGPDIRLCTHTLPSRQLSSSVGCSSSDIARNNNGIFTELNDSSYKRQLVLALENHLALRSHGIDYRLVDCSTVLDSIEIFQNSLCRSYPHCSYTTLPLNRKSFPVMVLGPPH